MELVAGVVQRYAWGDPWFIAGLLGVEPDGEPWAELWLGTHPGGPGRLGDGRLLSEVAGELGYLLKVLAALEPLSLQTHPNRTQAIDGFARGVFRDDRSKPELLVALTRFVALCGIRPAPATLALLDALGADSLAAAVASVGPGGALAQLLRGELDPGPAIEACRHQTDAEAQWVVTLDELYPGEPSVAATLLLNLVHLAPGEAIRLDAGNLHAYLHGSGIELMGASDNVVRAGLTPKTVDVDELLATLDPTPLEQPILHPDADGRFALPDAGVALAVIEGGRRHVASGHELAIGLDGVAWYLAPGDHLTTTATTYVVVPL